MCNFGVSFMLFRYATLSALMFTSATDVWHVETEPRLFQHNSFTAFSPRQSYNSVFLKYCLCPHSSDHIERLDVIVGYGHVI